MWNWLVKLIAKRYLKKKGLVGLTEDTKTVKGEDTGKTCITFYVGKKLPLDKIDKKDRIPKRVLWLIPTDVEEMGLPTIQKDRKRYLPLQGGCEIGVRGSKAVGTAGNIFYKEELLEEGKTLGKFPNLSFLSESVKKRFKFKTVLHSYIGTNLHVVANGSSFENPIGNKITQPGTSLYGIGEVIDYIPLKKDKINEFDEALVKIGDTFPVRKDIIKVGNLKGFAHPEKGMEVRKYGRTTEYTEGTIVNTRVVMNINFGKKDGLVIFKDMVVIKPKKGYKKFSDKGDSGSLIVTKDGDAVVRLNSGNGSTTFGIPFPKIMKRMKVWL